MNISKDIYEYLTNFADDRTILNMLSVNKKFNDEQFFKRVFLRKYPLLLDFQKENETLKGLFVRMTYYIAKLEEEYGIPYIPTRDYDPEAFYKYGYAKMFIYDAANTWASEGGHIELVKLMLGKGANNFSEAIQHAAEFGHIDIVRLMLDKGATRFNSTMADAGMNGHIDIVQLMLDRGADDFNQTMVAAADGDHIDIVRLMLDKGANNFSRVLKTKPSIDIVKLILSQVDFIDVKISVSSKKVRPEPDTDIVNFILEKGIFSFE